MVETTRKTIIKIFIDCENDYKKGIQLYRAITLDKKLIQETRRISNHKKMRERLIHQEDIDVTNTVESEGPSTYLEKNDEIDETHENKNEQPLFVR